MVRLFWIVFWLCFWVGLIVMTYGVGAIALVMVILWKLTSKPKVRVESKTVRRFTGFDPSTGRDWSVEVRPDGAIVRISPNVAVATGKIIPFPVD